MGEVHFFFERPLFLTLEIFIQGQLNLGCEAGSEHVGWPIEFDRVENFAIEFLFFFGIFDDLVVILEISKKSFFRIDI